MGNASRVLVVDGDCAVLQTCRDVLCADGYSVHTVCDASSVHNRAFDLFIVDHASWLAMLRSAQENPLRGIDSKRLILIGRDDIFTDVLARELQAADYIRKPFCGSELTVRARIVSCRLQADRIGSDPLSLCIARFADWTFDAARLELIRTDGRSERLTTAEAGLLKLFLRSPHRILTREQLLQGDACDAGSFDRSVDVLVSRLRKKLERDIREPTLICTVYGAGYQLSADVLWFESPPRI